MDLKKTLKVKKRALMNQDFENFCEQQFDSIFSENSELSKTDFKDGMKYSFFSGGKRIRPLLMTLFGKHIGLREDQIYPAAFALECIHTYSLIHDDLPSMDNDEIRRGKPTHHIKYGEAHAVLSGDALLTYAFEIIARFYDGDVVKNLVLSLSQCAGPFGMVGGQVLDCLTDQRSVSIFEEIHYLKTAKLFMFSLRASAVIAGKDPLYSGNASSLGASLGMLFQLQDDLLDIDKKTDRKEENITSLISVSELETMIKNKKVEINSLIKEFELDKNSEFMSLLDKLYNRKN